MIHCVGWKRSEANRKLEFEHVTPGNFNAILLRSLVRRAKSRFEDREALAGGYEQVPDPELGGFLRSQPAAAAGLQLQSAFEAEHSREACQDMKEKYVTWSGDSGMTERVMREACNLPPRDHQSGNHLQS